MCIHATNVIVGLRISITSILVSSLSPHALSESPANCDFLVAFTLPFKANLSHFQNHVCYM